MAYSYTCREAGLACEFLVQSEDREEVEQVAHEHRHRAHPSELSGGDIDGAIVEITF